MNLYHWWVSFEGPGPEVAVTAGAEDEAKVLAQAQRIRQGQEWRRVVGAVKVDVAVPRRSHVNPLA